MPARDLSRMGAANVALTVSHSGQAVIEKSPVGAVEFGFYQNAATSLNEAGIATPALFSADATLRKLCMEYIPYPVEQSDVASDEVLTMLARLHRYPVNTAWHYHPHSWSEMPSKKRSSCWRYLKKAHGSFSNFSSVVMCCLAATVSFQGTAMRVTGEEEKTVRSCCSTGNGLEKGVLLSTLPHL